MELNTLHRIADSFFRPRILIGWVIIVALVRFLNLGFLDLQAWDEGLYALRSKSIVQFGDWLDQTAHVPGGLATSCYPPLTFWTTAAFFKLFGASEWTTRLTSALFGSGSVLLIVVLARRLASRESAMFTGILFGTNLFYTFYTRQGQLDVAYISFLLLSVYGWLVWSEGERRRRGLVLIALGTCGAFMSKILVGLYVPLILLVVQAIHARHRWSWRGVFDISAAMGAGLVLALPWHVFMYLRHGQAFLDAFLGLHVLQRLSAPIEGHNPALGMFFYINQLLVRYPESALGIGLIILLLFKRIDRAVLSQRLVAIASAWSLVVLTIITVMATKIPQYMLPLSVPVALLGGATLGLFPEGRVSRRLSLMPLALLSLTTAWSALWPLREYLRGSVIGLTGVNPYHGLPWATAVIALVCTGFLVVTMWRRRTSEESDSKSLLFPIILLMLFTLQLIIEVAANDRTQYDVGTKQVASILREHQAQRVVYVGKDLNPALDLYLKGWDSWREDIRLDYQLAEATALAPKGSDIELPRPGEEVFAVVEQRIAGDRPITDLLRLQKKTIFSNSTYRVYKLTSSK